MMHRLSMTAAYRLHARMTRMHHNYRFYDRLTTYLYDRSDLELCEICGKFDHPSDRIRHMACTLGDLPMYDLQLLFERMCARYGCYNFRGNLSPEVCDPCLDEHIFGEYELQPELEWYDPTLEDDCPNCGQLDCKGGTACLYNQYQRELMHGMPEGWYTT